MGRREVKLAPRIPKRSLLLREKKAAHRAARAACIEGPEHTSARKSWAATLFAMAGTSVLPTERRCPQHIDSTVERPVHAQQRARRAPIEPDKHAISSRVSLARKWTLLTGGEIGRARERAMNARAQALDD